MFHFIDMTNDSILDMADVILMQDNFVSLHKLTAEEVCADKDTMNKTFEEHTHTNCTVSQWGHDCVTWTDYILIRSACFIPNSHQKHVWNVCKRKKEEIWLSPMTKAPTTTHKIQKATWQHKNATKTSITQRLRTDLWRSVRVTIATKLMWLNGFTGFQPFHYPQKLCYPKWHI